MTLLILNEYVEKRTSEQLNFTNVFIKSLYIYICLYISSNHIYDIKSLWFDFLPSHAFKYKPEQVTPLL